MTSERRFSMAGAVVTSLVAYVAVAACSKQPPPPKAPVASKPTLVLAVLAAESDKFPSVAEAATRSLAKAKVAGVGPAVVSKVSLEVVQLSIECLEPTPECYQAVGKSLSANRLLFAQVEPAAKKPRRAAKDVRVTITLFDVDTRAPTKTAERVFASETEATAGIETLIAEATAP